MSQYKTGTVTVTNGSATVTGSGTSWSANVAAGDLFTIIGSSVPYIVGSVGSDTSLTLTSTYAGVTASAQSYAITTSFTPILGIPYMEQGDLDTATIYKRGMLVIEDFLNTTSFVNLTITGNTTIGDAAGDTLTINAGTTTFSQGTANGVLYLNGSKVATSGSALVFDGTNFGIGASSPSVKLHVASAGSLGSRVENTSGTGAAYVQVKNTAGSTILGQDSTGGYLLTDYAAPLLFYINSSEQMRLTSTGLGIGTSSPSRKLVVQATDSTTNSKYIVSQFNRETSGTAAAGIGGYIQFQAEDDAGTQREAALIGWDLSDVSAASPKGRLYLGSRGVNDAVVIDNSGNLGLGVTPSAWAASFKAQQIGNVSSIWTASNTTGISNNFVYDGANKYITTNYATSYEQGSGAHKWYNAASGTAGNAITFTQAMTLAASGNLLIGTTTESGSGRLRVVDSVRIADSTTETNALLITTSGTTATIETRYAKPIVFGTDGTERARIDSSGNLLVGTTSAITTSAGFFASPLGYLYASASNDYSMICNRIGSDGTIISFRRSSTTVGSVSVTTTATAYNTSSDQRLKENIQDAAPASALIDSLQVREFDWKADGSHQRYGFVAQELVTVAPEAVYQPADPEEMMAVDYSKLVPMLVKEIQSLRARVAALES